MADLEHLNIGFLNSLEAKNRLDLLAIELAVADGNVDELSLDDLKLAFAGASEGIKPFADYKFTPERLFADIRAYLTLRWFKHGACRTDQTPACGCTETVWTFLALTDYAQMKAVRELVSIFAYTHPGTRLTDIIERSLFAAKESSLIGLAQNCIGDLAVSDAERILSAHAHIKNVTAGAPKKHAKEPKPAAKKEEIIIETIERIEGFGAKSVSNADMILRIIEGAKKSELKSFILSMLEKKREVEKALTLDMEKMVKLEDALTWDKEEEGLFRYPPPADTFGAYLAGRLAVIGVADTEIVKRMLSLLDSDGCDPKTKAGVADALRRTEYADKEAERIASHGLLSLLKSYDKSHDEDGMVPGYILFAMKSLVHIWQAHLKETDVANVLDVFAYAKGHPEARLTAVYLLGIVGSHNAVSKETKTSILQTLSDRLGDQESGVVAHAAYIAYNKVQTTIGYL